MSALSYYLERFGSFSAWFLNLRFLDVADRRQSAINKVYGVMLVVLLLCCADFIRARFEDRARWQKDYQEWKSKQGDVSMAMPDWYTVPAKIQLKQATFFQVDTKTLPDLPAVVYVPAFLSLIAALGILWRDSLSTRKRANQKEDERDKNDIETTRVFSGLESVLRNLPDVIDRKIREGFENLRSREH